MALRVENWLGATFALLLWGAPALAQLPPSTKAPHFGKIVAQASPSPEQQATEVVVQVESRAQAIELGLVPIDETLATFRGSWSEVVSLRRLLGNAFVHWSPGRRLAMDQATQAIRLPQATANYGVDGSGVIVGVVDTGIDVRHPAFLRPDGTTRIRWLLAYDEQARGVHSVLEAEYGCTSLADPCAVYSADDINAVLSGARPSNIPIDSFGHGSHVAGIAAGGEQSYPGVAPGADLVIVKGARGVAMPDARILEGTRFIFDRAAELFAPAVVNLSLGSGFGAHDGSSMLELGLRALAQGPGRIVVVAAGNEGALYQPIEKNQPFPVGSHTEVTVPSGAEVRVSLFESSADWGVVDRALYVWLALSPDEELRVGLRNSHGELVQPLAFGGEAVGAPSLHGMPGDYQYYVGYGAADEFNVGQSGENAVVLIAGNWPKDTSFEVVLVGRGTARAWIDASADYGLPFRGYFGRARVGGSVAIPATAPGLISVGASVNRESWTDYSGAVVANLEGAVGSRAFFSSAGPSQLAQLKPDLIAPGGGVVSVMSAAADPRTESPLVPQAEDESQFSSHGACEDPLVECFVVDDLHGVSSGTSMAAPVVTGAVALLLSRQPSLTQQDVRSLLFAGAVASPQQDQLSGAGSLDVEALLRAQEALIADLSGSGERPPTSLSRFVLADSFLVPDLNWRLEGLVLLKDAVGLPAGGLDASRVRVLVEGEADLTLLELKDGNQRFVVNGRPGQGEQTVVLRAYYGDQLVAETAVPVFVDAASALGGLELTGGTCRYQPAGSPGGWPALLVLLIGLAALLRMAPAERRT